MSKLRNNLVSVALEELDPIAQAEKNGQVKDVSGEDKLVTMDGPLSIVFGKALNIAYAKPDFTGEVIDGESKIAQESQINDVYHLAQIARENDAVEPIEAATEVYKVYSFGTTPAADNTLGDTIEVLRDLPGKVPFDMVFVENAVAPANGKPMGQSSKDELVILGSSGDSYAVESMATVLRLRKLDQVK